MFFMVVGILGKNKLFTEILTRLVDLIHNLTIFSEPSLPQEKGL